VSKYDTKFAKIETSKKATVDFRGQLKTTEKKEFNLEDIMKDKEKHEEPEWAKK